ncbi:MAG TPA: hypothetical protein VNU66_12710, partial [Mycobacteriales bacterium]|nr:hypothetical protein [Mycobacteriales bacterium]
DRLTTLAARLLGAQHAQVSLRADEQHVTSIVGLDLPEGPTPAEAQPTAGTVVDLMAALRASVEAAKKGRPAAAADLADAGAADEEPAAARTAPAKEAPAKRAAAKKAAPKAAAKSAAKTTGRAAGKTAGDKGKAGSAAKKPARKSA